MKHLPALLAYVAGAVLSAEGSGFGQPPGWTLLESTKPVEGQLAGGQSDEYRFTLRAGDHASLSAEQRSIDLTVQVHGPGGQTILALNSFRIGDAEQAEIVASISGVYRVRLAPAEPNAPPGAYAITLSPIAPATQRDRDRAAAVRAFAKGTALNRQGARGAIVRSLAHFSGALAHWRSAGEQTQVATTVNAIALAYIEIGNQPKALEYASLALESAQAAGDRRTEARALDSLGEVHNHFGDKRKAAGYYEQALPLMRSTGDRAGEGERAQQPGCRLRSYGRETESPRVVRRGRPDLPRNPGPPNAR